MVRLRSVAILAMALPSAPVAAQSDGLSEGAWQLVEQTLTEVEAVLRAAEAAHLDGGQRLSSEYLADYAERGSLEGVELDVGSLGFGLYSYLMNKAQFLASSLESEEIRVSGYSITVALPPSLTIEFEYTQ